MSTMRDLLGKTVKVDPLSLTGLRNRFARVCMEMRLDKLLLPSLTLFDSAQKVEYEGLHQISSECGKYGHCIEECPNLLPTDSQAVNEDNHTPHEEGSSVKSPSPYGSWMMPNY